MVASRRAAVSCRCRWECTYEPMQLPVCQGFAPRPESLYWSVLATDVGHLPERLWMRRCRWTWYPGCVCGYIHQYAVVGAKHGVERGVEQHGVDPSSITCGLLTSACLPVGKVLVNETSGQRGQGGHSPSEWSESVFVETCEWRLARAKWTWSEWTLRAALTQGADSPSVSVNIAPEMKQINTATLDARKARTARTGPLHCRL